MNRLPQNLRAAFPEMKGFSPTNLKYVRRVAEECPARIIGQQPADQLPWFHILVPIAGLFKEAEQERQFRLSTIEQIEAVLQGELVRNREGEV